ncbi:hypothetical protein MKW94_024318 [Papaver nudicaule]|uniref:Uncharacterized protein n=1 Tax=Papaver nudicaule TaxID=74823 RepID=A0AA42B4X9_PAPNU|nr:hypothetical protein [Papaver nudicaule]
MVGCSKPDGGGGNEAANKKNNNVYVTFSTRDVVCEKFTAIVHSNMYRNRCTCGANVPTIPSGNGSCLCKQRSAALAVCNSQTEEELPPSNT